MHRRDFLSRSLFGITAAAVPVTLQAKQPIHRMLPAPSPYERGWPTPDFKATFRDVPGIEQSRILYACLSNWCLRRMMIRYEQDRFGAIKHEINDGAAAVAAFWADKFEPYVLANWNAAVDLRAFYGLETAEGWMERERRDDFDVLTRKRRSYHVEETEYGGGPHWPRQEACHKAS